MSEEIAQAAGDLAYWQHRAETAEMATLRMMLKIRFLVDEVREYIAEQERIGSRNTRLAMLKQSIGIAESILRESEPWRAVEMRIALLTERAETAEAEAAQLTLFGRKPQ